MHSAGFTGTATASDMSEALAVAKRTPLDLILIDIYLSEDERDGFDLLQQLRRDGYGKLAVLVTGDRSMALLFQAARAGANDFLVKNPRLDLGMEVDRIFEFRQSPDDCPAEDGRAHFTATAEKCALAAR